MSEDVISFYMRNAAKWDAARGRQPKNEPMEKGWLDRWLSLASPGGHFLDVGCGTGDPIARYVIEAGYSVTGVDAVPEMIATCRTRFPEQTWLVADMRDLVLETQFDAIIAWDSFFHLNHKDQTTTLAHFGRLAKLGAPLLFTAGPSHGTAENPLWGEPLYHASYAEDEYRTLLDQNGFTYVHHYLEDPSCGDHSIYLAQKEF